MVSGARACVQACVRLALACARLALDCHYSLRSLIERLIPVIPPPEHSFSEWRRFWSELTLARFLWVARWNPGGPMITGCPRIVGVPLLSHLGSTLIFLGRVIRQLGGLQDIPAEADRLPFRI
ncbi:hypothetical protein CRG98_037700 [Punica granatum]|uniref:Uncharacterized protein n=1 Tax=Punica granatum TaxID=22663 RepID=A0A2I0IEW7_PUNGR|nr:hypothetical protein CRG98_037700 [Punica granatum]